MKRIVSIGIVVLLCLVILNTMGKAQGDNLAGDLDQLPENEEMLDLSDGEYDGTYNSGIYHKNNTYVMGLITDPTHPNYLPPENLFNGEHSSAYTVGRYLYFHFSQQIKITRIRLYPMDDEGNKAPAVRVYNSIFQSGEIFLLNATLTTSITDKTHYLEHEYNNFITSHMNIMWDSVAQFNEIEIYYDRYYNPYHYTSEINYNYTNITNEYNNDTYLSYQNDTYINNTYLNSTYQNDTYINQTNATTRVIHENITNLNNTYLNETTLSDNQRLETKLNEVWEQLNDTKEGEEVKESKSLADSTYSDPILIILLLAIIVLQIIMFLKKKKGQGETTEGSNTIEPEVEHTPRPGFSRETEVDIISRKVQQEKLTEHQPPPAQPTQYQHRQPQSSAPIPPGQSMTPQPMVTSPQVQTPPPAKPQEQKSLPEHQFTP